MRSRPLLISVLFTGIAVGCSSGHELLPEAERTAPTVTTTLKLRATDVACQTSLDSMRIAIMLFYATNGRWPTRIAELGDYVKMNGTSTSADGTIISGSGWTAELVGDGTSEPKIAVTGATSCV